jgi:glycosyltransferase involved in cell wall biosynthesis
MKILTIVSDSVCGGATISILNLLKGLKRHGDEIYVITPNEGYLCDELRSLGIEYHIIKYVFSVMPPTKSIIDWLLLVPKLFKMFLINIIAFYKILFLVDSYTPDIIHTNVSVIDLGFKIARKRKIPHVWHIREYGDLDFDLNYFPNRSSLIQKISRQSYAIAITNDLFNYFQLDTSRSKIIYNGILPCNASVYHKEKKNYFLYAGRLTEGKGVKDMIKAFVYYSNKNTSNRLLLLGSCSPSYRDELYSFYHNTNAEPLIDFVGHVDNVFEYMRYAKALIVPSFHEGFGRITAEAMFNGCLVIGRDTSGTKEQFDNGVSITGQEIALRFKTIEQLVMDMMIVDKFSSLEYEKIVLRSQEVVVKLYSNEVNLTSTIHFLNDILNKKNNAVL